MGTWWFEKGNKPNGTQRWHARVGSASIEEVIMRTEILLEGLMPQEMMKFYNYPKSLGFRVHTLYIL